MNKVLISSIKLWQMYFSRCVMVIQWFPMKINRNRRNPQWMYVLRPSYFNRSIKFTIIHLMGIELPTYWWSLSSSWEMFQFSLNSRGGTYNLFVINSLCFGIRSYFIAVHDMDGQIILLYSRDCSHQQGLLFLRVGGTAWKEPMY
jgi:hypothetical protein